MKQKINACSNTNTAYDKALCNLKLAQDAYEQSFKDLKVYEAAKPIWKNTKSPQEYKDLLQGFEFIKSCVALDWSRLTQARSMIATPA